MTKQLIKEIQEKAFNKYINGPECQCGMYVTVICYSCQLFKKYVETLKLK